MVLERLLPKTATNEYRGHRIALWFFLLYTAVTIARSLVHLAAPDGGAQSIATIPLHGFSRNAAATVIHLFGLWGVSQLVVGVVCLVAAVRYRSLVPLCYLLGAGEYALRLLLSWVKPIEIEGTAPGGVANYVLVPLLLLMLWLSLRPARPARGGAAETGPS